MKSMRLQKYYIIFSFFFQKKHLTNSGFPSTFSLLSAPSGRSRPSRHPSSSRKSPPAAAAVGQPFGAVPENPKTSRSKQPFLGLDGLITLGVHKQFFSYEKSVTALLGSGGSQKNELQVRWKCIG